MDPAREVGGDFYDFFMIDNDHLALVIADVTDKGVPAALLMMSRKILIDYCAHMDGSPSRVLSNVNSKLCEENESGMFVYTDGVPEANNAEGQMYSLARMELALNRIRETDPESVLNGVRADVDAFVKNADQFDDLTMLCVTYK